MDSSAHDSSGRSLSIFSLFRRYPAFARFWLGTMVSALGDNLTWMALTWYLVERTGSGAAVGTVLLCFAIPAAITAGPFGRLLDRWEPRRVMMLDNIARTVVIGLIPLLDSLGALSLPALYTLTAMAGALSPATEVGKNLAVVRLVDDRDLEAANAAESLTGHVPTVLGPAIAGVLIAAWGPTRALIIDAASFAFMAWAVAIVPDRQPAPAAVVSAKPGGRPTPFPLLELLRHPAALLVTALSAVFYFSYGPTEAAMPLFVRNHLHSDSRGLGALWLAVGVGAIAGNFAVGWLSRWSQTGVVLATIAILWGICQLLFAFTDQLWLGFVFLLLGGVAWGPYLPLKTTLLQRTIPPERLGAILGAQTALLSPTAPLGTALGGLMLLRLSPSAVIAASAAACIVAGLTALTRSSGRRAA